MKPMLISPVFTQDCFKILTFFSLSPGSRWRRKDIKERTKMHNVPLDNALNVLLHTQVLCKERNYYALNLENDYTKQLIDVCRKQYQQLREIPLDVCYLVLDFAAAFASWRGMEAYLFGSYAKLVYRENSDVDIALLYAGEVDRKRLAQVVQEGPKPSAQKGKLPLLVLKLQKIYHKNVELHHFERAAFYKNKKDPLVRGILKDGIRLW